MQTESLFDASVKIGETLALMPSYKASLGVSKGSSAGGIIDLCLKACQGPWMLKQEVENGRQTDSSRLRARKRHANSHGLDQGLRHEFRVGLMGCQEFGEQVWRLYVYCLRVWLFVGQVWQSFSHAIVSEARNGEGGVDEAPLRELEVDGVLEKESVKEWDLSNLERQGLLVPCELELR
jgi:hypothetical protein